MRQFHELRTSLTSTLNLILNGVYSFWYGINSLTTYTKSQVNLGHIHLWVMLTSSLRALVNNPVKKIFIGKEIKKKKN